MLAPSLGAVSVAGQANVYRYHSLL